MPFDRFPDVDTILGPEMRSTGEVMGIDRSFGLAFAKSQTAARNRLPARAPCSSRSPTATSRSGMVVARRFAELGFGIVATAGTAAALEAEGLDRRGGDRATDRRRRGSRPRCGRAAFLGQDRPRREHAARPRSPCRRRPHPPHRDRPGHPVRHHRRRRPRRVRRDRRVVPPRARGALPPGVPPTTASSAWTCDAPPSASNRRQQTSRYDGC